jgi:hypothetical protein
MNEMPSNTTEATHQFDGGWPEGGTGERSAAIACWTSTSVLWSDRVDPAWIGDIAATTPVRVFALRGVALDRPRAWAGLYEMSPDHCSAIPRSRSRRCWSWSNPERHASRPSRSIGRTRCLRHLDRR